MEEKTNNKEPVDTAVLQVMLEELSANQDVTGQQLTQLLKDVLVLSNQLSQLAQKPVTTHSAVPDQTIAIQATVERVLSKHLSTNAINSAKTVKEYRFLLFPEQDRTLFYRIVFGRWLLYLLIMLALNNGYKFAVHYLDNQKQVQLKRAESNKLDWSLQYVYDHSGKATRRLMETAYFKSKSADSTLIKH